MSALVLRKRSRADLSLHFIGCDTPGCVAHKHEIAHHGRTSGMYEALMCGYHAAWLCESCKRRWKRMWAEARVPPVPGDTLNEVAA